MTNLFLDLDKIKTYLSDYRGEYEEIVVKETYDILPEVSYPCIDIDEIENVLLEKYKDDTGEFATGLTYQFNISCEQDEYHTAIENVRRISHIINEYFQEERYKCLDRIGGLNITPHINDKNVITAHLRYTCAVVGNENTIYRRYK